MVGHNLKSLQHSLHDLQSMSDHFGMLRIKGLRQFLKCEKPVPENCSRCKKLLLERKQTALELIKGDWYCKQKVLKCNLQMPQGS